MTSAPPRIKPSATYLIESEEQARKAAGADHAWVITQAWSSPYLPADLAAEPVPEVVSTYLADAADALRERFLLNRAIPLPERVRVARGMPAPARRVVRGLFTRASFTLAEAASYLSLLRQDQAQRLVLAGYADGGAVIWFQILQQGAISGDEKIRATVAASAVLAERPETVGYRLPLDLFLTDPSPFVRAALAANKIWDIPTLPRSRQTVPLSPLVYRTTYALLADPDATVRSAARQHLLNFCRIACHEVSGVVCADAAARATGPDGLWPDWLEDRDPRLRVSILDEHRAGERYFTACGYTLNEVLERLLAAPEPEVRARLAQHALASPSVLTTLVGDPDPRVRAAVAKAKAVPADVLSRLVDDPVAAVRRAAADRFVRALRN